MKLLGLFFLLFSLSHGALAGLIAESTRIIYLPEFREHALMLANTNDYPVVVQTWVDNGDVDNTPDQAKAPFMVLPAVFKIQPGAAQGIRIINKGDSLPSDRESVYWLNLYEIPPKGRRGVETQAQVAMAMNTQMKIFYRPNGLTPSPEKAMKNLMFSLKNIDNQYIMITNNPTPYYVSFGQIQLQSPQGSYLIAQSMDMMTPPFSTRSYSFEQPPTSLKDELTVSYTYFDDVGNQVKNSQSVTTAP